MLNEDIYAGSLINRFRKAFKLPQIEIGDVYAILRWNGIKPIRYEVRVDGKGKSPIYNSRDIDGLLNNINAIAYSRDRLLHPQTKQDKTSGHTTSVSKPVYNYNNHAHYRTPEMQAASDELLKQQEVFFNESKDDELYNQLFGKKVYLTEKQVKHIQENLLLEGDSRLKIVNRIMDNEFSGLLDLDAPVRGAEYYINNNPNTTWRQYILFSLRHTFGLMTNADVKYLPIVAKLAFSNEVRFEKTNDNGREIATLQKIVRLMKKDENVFQQLNNQNITFSQAYNIVKKEIEAIERVDAENANNVETRSDYDIIEVPDYETAHYYGEFTCSNSKLCYTQNESTWRDYKGHKNQNRVYVCLKHGWKTIPEQPGAGNPYDEYGTSMIFVFISPDGDIATSNCRWNHSVTGEYEGSVDNAFTKTTLAQTVGVNFDSVFKPYNDEQLINLGIIPLNRINQLLQDGIKPEKIFDTIQPCLVLGNTTYSVVHSTNKKNILVTKHDDNQHEFNSLLIQDTWFDTVYPFKHTEDGSNIYPTLVIIGHGNDEKSNYVKIDGSYVFPLPRNQWLKYGGTFINGFAPISVEGKGWNYIDVNGELLSKDMWFDKTLPFLAEGCGSVHWQNKMNLIRRDGTLVSDTWFEAISRYTSTGYAVIYKDENTRQNIVTYDGKMLSPDLWFDCVYLNENSEGTFIVEFNEKYNFISKYGLLWKQEPDDWFDYAYDFHHGFAVVEDYPFGANYIGLDGQFLSKEWFDEAHRFDPHGNYSEFAMVERDRGRDREYNLINTSGDLISPNKWFIYAKPSIKTPGGYLVRYTMDKEILVMPNGECYDAMTKAPIKLQESKNMKKVYLTEKQIEYIKKYNTETTHYVDPAKVLLIRKYLDDNFVRATMSIIDSAGYPAAKEIVGMKGTDGEVIRNMTSKQLFYLLQDKFKGIYGDKQKRDAFIKQVMIDWYNKKITNDGLLSKNNY